MFKPDSVENVATIRDFCAVDKDFALNSINAVPRRYTVPDFAIDPIRRSESDWSYMSSTTETGSVYRDDEISFMTSESERPSYRQFLANGYCRSRYFCHTEPPCTRAELEKIKKQFPDFTFLLFCGRGRFGNVWLVQDPSEQIIALKMLAQTAFRHLKTEKDGLTAYRNKIRNFEHLVQIYHVGQTEDFFYYTMEAAYSISNKFYIPITLARLLEHYYFSPMDSADISCDILDGLAVLHANGLAHRDIKPENIILVDNQIKICDISLVSNKDKKSYAGTEFFIPQDIDDIPVEQFGVNCDLFAAGKVLYSVLANEKDITEFPQIDRDILKDNLAKKLNLILNKACDPAYKNRFSSAYDFMQAMSRIYAHA